MVRFHEPKPAGVVDGQLFHVGEKVLYCGELWTVVHVFQVSPQFAKLRRGFVYGEVVYTLKPLGSHDSNVLVRDGHLQITKVGE